MRVLVTGAAGFVGSHLVRAARERGHDVVAAVHARARSRHLDGSRAHVVECDLADGHGMRRLAVDAAPDLAVHLAWSIGSDYRTSHDNLACVGGSLALLQGLLEVGCPRIVFAGSHLELAPTGRDMAESDPVAPQTLYATCKDAVRRMADHAVAGTASTFVWARLFNLYGPGQVDWALVPWILRHVSEGRRCPLTNGDQERGFIHVRDAAEALLALGESTVRGIVHVGSDEAIRVRELAVRVASRLGRADLLDFGARVPPPDDAPRIVPSIGRLRTEVGHRPRLDMDEGLRETVEWWRTRNPSPGTK